jgi:hypothetical protein
MAINTTTVPSNIVLRGKAVLDEVMEMMVGGYG